jgi:hypothetical protein
MRHAPLTLAVSPGIALTADHLALLAAAEALSPTGRPVAVFDLCDETGFCAVRINKIRADLARWNLWRWGHAANRGTTDPDEIEANHVRMRCARRATLSEAGCRWDDRDDGGQHETPARAWRAERSGPTDRPETAKEACDRLRSEWRRLTGKAVA